MKKLFITLFVGLMTITGAQAQRFALIDMEYILENIDEYQTATEKIQKASEKYQKEVESLTEEAKKLYESYQKAGNISDSERTKRENAIINKEKEASELKNKYYGQDGELAKMQDELLQPIEDKIYEAVKAVAQKKSYALILDRASDAAIMFASPSIDVSDEVLEQLGIN